MKKKYLARRNSFFCSILVLVIWSINLIALILFETKAKQVASGIITIIFLSWVLALPWGYKTISFEEELIVYKKNLFSKKYLIPYECLKKYI